MSRECIAEGTDVAPIPAEHTLRITRTLAETFQAGWDDGADDRPLSSDEVRKIAGLVRPYLKRNQQKSA
jgi:hypothetical protein